MTSVEWVGLIAFLVLGGCAPELQVGSSGMERLSREVQMVHPDTSRMIAYRELRLDDFQGERPPKEFVHHTSFFGAVTCIYLRAEPEVQVSSPAEDGEGRTEHVASIERVVFRALVDRACSWRNETVEGLSPLRVLQHEQVHFALFEIAARRLNARMLAQQEYRRFRAGSAEGAKKIAQRFVDRLLREAMLELNERNIRFDRETEGGGSWERQQRWWRQVEAELLEMVPYAAAELTVP